MFVGKSTPPSVVVAGGRSSRSSDHGREWRCPSSTKSM